MMYNWSKVFQGASTVEQWFRSEILDSNSNHYMTRDGHRPHILWFVLICGLWLNHKLIQTGRLVHELGGWFTNRTGSNWFMTPAFFFPQKTAEQRGVESWGLNGSELFCFSIFHELPWTALKFVKIHGGFSVHKLQFRTKAWSGNIVLLNFSKTISSFWSRF